MICPKCGTEIPEGNAFCEECGERVLSEDDKKSYREKTETLDERTPIVDADMAGGRGIIIPDIDFVPEEGPDFEERGRSPRTIIMILLILALISGGIGFGITKIINNDESGDKGSAEKETSEETAEPAESEEERAETEAASHVIAGRGTEDRFDSIDGMASWVDDGARMIEQDVSMSRDGTLYICYEPANVEYSYDSAIDMPKLSDAFDRFSDDEDVIFVVELKTTTDAAARALIDLVEDYGYEDRVIAQSFDAGILRPVKDAFPDMRTMYLISRNSIGRGQPTLDQALSYDYIDIISVNDHSDGMMTRDNCDRVHSADKEFGAFILYDTDSVEKAIDMGIDYYFISGGNMSPGAALALEKDRRN